MQFISSHDLNIVIDPVIIEQNRKIFRWNFSSCSKHVFILKTCNGYLHLLRQDIYILVRNKNICMYWIDRHG